MSVSRFGASIGVLDGVMYVVGGNNGSGHLKSVEAYRPSTGVWSSIADMHLWRFNPGDYNTYFFENNICRWPINLKLNFEYRSVCIEWFIVCYWWKTWNYLFTFCRNLQP